MKNDELFHLGKIVKPYGSKGEVILRYDPEIKPDFKISEPLFIEIDGFRVPFFIASATMRPDGQCTLLFDDIATVDETRVLMNCEVFIPEKRLTKSRGRKYRQVHLEGFMVEDVNAGSVGQVKQVIELTHQSLLAIDRDGKEILVPLVDEIIAGIDIRAKRILIDTPEGLLDL